MDLFHYGLFKLVKIPYDILATICKLRKKVYICRHQIFNGMKNLWKKLVEMAVIALVPVLIDYVKDFLDDLKKKIQDEK